MMLVPSNAVRLFARTSILVVATGLFHGIFLLPIIVRSFAFDMNETADKKKINNSQIFSVNSSNKIKPQIDKNDLCDSNEMWKIKEITKCS